MAPEPRTIARGEGSRRLRARLGHWLMAFLAAACLQASGPVAAAGDAEHRLLLRGAWLVDGEGLVGGVDLGSPAGGSVDLDLLEAIGRRVHLGFSLQRMAADDVAAAFASGTLDFVLPVQSHERLAERGRLSHPFGARTDVLLCLPDLPALAGEGAAALREATDRGWRIAAGGGRSHGPEPDVILAEARGRDLIRWAGNDLELVEALLAGEAQCLLAPRLALMTALSQRPQAETFIGHQRRAMTELRTHILFNAATVDAATIAAIDRTLLALQEDGTAAELRRQAARPTLLGFAVATAWFSWFDIVGTIAFALSGVLIARAEGYSLLGAFVLASLPAVGGGVLRDLLVAREPIGIVASPLPLTLVLATVLAAYVLYTVRDRLDAPLRRLAAGRFRSVQWPRLLRFENLLELTDAIGLAAFTVLGVVVAVRVGAEPLWLWGPLCAALSGAGGGILRDILRVGYDNPALRTSFYAEVCLCWGLLLSLAVLHLLTEEDVLLLRVSIGVAVLGAFATRMLVVVYKVRSPRF